jgi:hypothetical protein
MGKPVRARTLTGEIRKDRANARALLNRSPFFGTGMHPNGEGGIDSDNFVAGTSGYSFGSDGNAEFNDLTLRGGIIGNDALTNPVRGDSAYTATSGFSLDTVGATPLASQSWFTPDGFTTADILIVGRVFAYNNTAGLDYLQARSRVYIPSTGAQGYGNAMPVAVSGSSGSGKNDSPISIKVEGLTDGQEIRLQVQAWTSFANWAANAGNIADVSGQIIWTR